MNAFQKHGIQHLSASSINLFIAQPALWCASYLMKRRTGVGPAAHRGTAIEAGIEAGLFDPEMPLKDCQDIALKKYHSLTRLSGDPRVEKERTMITGGVEQGLAELRQYGIPDKPEDGRQHKMQVMLGDIPVPFIGYLDFWWPQHGIIVDAKTTARVPSKISDPHNRQGALYTGAHSNHEVRMAYISDKKSAVYRVENAADHLKVVESAAQTIERLLSVSDDGEKLTRLFSPDLSSFYWGDASARALATEIWGPSPDSAPPAFAAVINE